jgi:hypothetical protein
VNVRRRFIIFLIVFLSQWVWLVRRFVYWLHDMRPLHRVVILRLVLIDINYLFYSLLVWSLLWLDLEWNDWFVDNWWRNNIWLVLWWDHFIAARSVVARFWRLFLMQEWAFDWFILCYWRSCLISSNLHLHGKLILTGLNRIFVLIISEELESTFQKVSCRNLSLAIRYCLSTLKSYCSFICFRLMFWTDFCHC